jgi:predicted RND superfamily exporter protein
MSQRHPREEAVLPLRIVRRHGAAVVRVARFALRFARWVGRRAAMLGTGWFESAVEQPKRVLVIAVVTALVGWLAGTQVGVVSDVTRLVPASQQEIGDLETLQDETGVSGDINVVVRSDKLTRPAVIRWMADYQKRILGRHGYQEGRPCREADICPALSLTNLFTSETTRPRQVRSLIDALPRYFSQAVITRDRHTANLAFGIRAMPLDEQKELVDDMRAQLDPPAGVMAELAGLPVLAADANADLERSRWLVTGVGIVAVLLVLLLAYRRLESALIPLVPVVLATGWSGLVLFVGGISLNPMSAALGALVVAISTEFSVILTARYNSERDGGLDPAAALRRVYRRTGRAVLASGVTATAGFAALTASEFRILRDFGLATMVDLGVALAGVMIVLPATLVWAEQRGILRHRVRESAPALGSEPG